MNIIINKKYVKASWTYSASWHFLMQGCLVSTITVILMVAAIATDARAILIIFFFISLEMIIFAEKIDNIITNIICILIVWFYKR